MLDVDATLARVAYDGPREPTTETLRGLHRAFMLRVPFENLDISLGRPIRLEPDALFDKIVRQRRGGFCYELNGLFAELLRALGFRVTRLSARVFGNAGPGPEFDHMALLVQLDERWLADVGFGDSFIEPLRMDEHGEQRQGESTYRLVQAEHGLVLQARRAAGQWENSYSFTLQPRQMADFAEMCLHQQTSPESHFTQKRICSQATPGGRVSLSDMRLIIRENGLRQERELNSPAEYDRALREIFGVRLEGA
jgi:N-hydroxyarylamine O-acetyltransferase